MLYLLISLFSLLGAVFGYPEFRLYEPSVRTSGTVFLGKSYRFDDARYLHLNVTVDAFEGIPYAEPPERFMPPEPKRTTPPPCVYNATFNRPICSQEPSIYVPTDYLETSEDCLYLSVYTPKLCERRDTNLAVMVWLHGGSFSFGMGANGIYSPVPIVAIGNVIVVTLNYRLGILGFMSTGDDVVPGNMGLLDQIMALQWIQANIKAFGGDPSKVTVFGDSAGAISAGIHLYSPKSAGLFNNVIMTSGTYLTPRFIVNQSTISRRSRALGKSLGCNQENSTEFVDCLRMIDVNALVVNQTERTLLETREKIGVVPPFTPVVDGSVILKRAMEMGQGKMNDANVIIGSSANEGSIFISLYLNSSEEPHISKGKYEILTKDIFIEYVSNPFLSDAIDMEYLNNKHMYKPNKNRYKELSEALGDWWFVCPADKTARELSLKMKNVYYYQMTQVPNASLWPQNWLKATHNEILTYIFGYQFNEHIPNVFGKLSEDDVQMTIKTILYFTNFAKTGNPNEENSTENPSADSLPFWGRFTIPELAYKKLSADMDSAEALKVKECWFWNDYYPRAVNLTGAIVYN